VSRGLSGWLEGNRRALQRLELPPARPTWEQLADRLRRTERRRQGQEHYQRVHVGNGALFVTYTLADARAVVDYYGGERRPHRVVCCNAEADWGMYRLKGGRWIPATGKWRRVGVIR
jgi:hypothetical protein